MDATRKQIDELYDTWLGRFRAFRKFLTILRNIVYEIADLRVENDKLRTALGTQLAWNKEQQEMNEKLGQIISELQEQVKPDNKLLPDFRTASQIMEERYKLYQGADNQ